MHDFNDDGFQLLEIPQKGTFRLIPEEDYKQLISLVEAANLLNISKGSLNIGEIIINYRKKIGLTQKELAKQSGVTVASICNVEKGKIKKPRQGTLSQLSKILGPEFESTLVTLNLVS
jgi:DNA-binding XRE family transcriptional regulator